MGNNLAYLTSFLLLALSQPLSAAGADVAIGTSNAPLEEPSAQKRLEASISAYKAGNVDQAIHDIDAAQRAGLTVSEAAKAHYYLGLAYRKQGKPGLAIAELTRALDEKHGLSDAQRADAGRNRSAARQEAGISETEAVVVESGVGKADDAVSIVPRAHGRVTTGALPPPTVASAWSGATKVAVAPPKRLAKLKTVYVTNAVPAASQPYVATPETTVTAVTTGALPLPAVASGWGGATRVAVAPPDPLAKLKTVYVTDTVAAASQPYVATPKTTVTAAVTAASPPQAHWPPPNIVPGTAPQPQVSAPAPAAVRQQVAEVASPPQAHSPPHNTAPGTGPQPQVNTPAPAAVRLQVGEVASPPQIHSPPPNTVPGTGPQPQVSAPAPAEVRLQVGEVASRNEAFALAVRLKSQRGGEIAVQTLQISEVVLDSGGTVYRLYLGPYTGRGQAQVACRSLRVSGYNCWLE